MYSLLENAVTPNSMNSNHAQDEVASQVDHDGPMCDRLTVVTCVTVVTLVQCVTVVTCVTSSMCDSSDMCDSSTVVPCMTV